MNIPDGLREIVNRDDRFSPEAYVFVSEAVSYTQEMLGRKGHISGQELVEGVRRYALEEFGYMARVVLESWGVRRTEDMGDIVFNLVNQGLLGKTEEDRREDFAAGYDFRKAFDESFTIDLIGEDQPQS
jgi:uncharacterized repeat protein (TIGR04138 family)